jgi:hypothetical protein
VEDSSGSGPAAAPALVRMDFVGVDSDAAAADSADAAHRLARVRHCRGVNSLDSVPAHLG